MMAFPTGHVIATFTLFYWRSASLTIFNFEFLPHVFVLLVQDIDTADIPMPVSLTFFAEFHITFIAYDLLYQSLSFH